MEEEIQGLALPYTDDALTEAADAAARLQQANQLQPALQGPAALCRLGGLVRADCCECSFNKKA